MSKYSNIKIFKIAVLKDQMSKLSNFKSKKCQFHHFQNPSSVKKKFQCTKIYKSFNPKKLV